MKSVMLEALENRALMSLVIDLRVAGAADGGKDVTVATVGQTIQLEAWGVVTGSNDVITDDGLTSAFGSFLSSLGGAVLGDLAVTELTPPYDSIATSAGKIQDLDGDGDLDVGSNEPPDAVSDYYFGRSRPITMGSDPAPGGGAQFKLADLTFTVSQLDTAGGSIALNFRPRPGSLRGIWMEDGVGMHSGIGTFAAGAPVVVTVQPPPTATIGGTVFIDQNGNGKLQKKDGPAVGFLVFDDVNGNGIHDADEASALTDAEGNFTLVLAPGTHTIGVVPQADYEPSKHLPTFYTITVEADEEVNDLLFGQEPI